MLTSLVENTPKRFVWGIDTGERRFGGDLGRKFSVDILFESGDFPRLAMFAFPK
jgi:hypothetical protein